MYNSIVVRTVLDFKWQSYAKNVFYFLFFLFTCHLLVVLVFSYSLAMSSSEHVAARCARGRDGDAADDDEPNADDADDADDAADAADDEDETTSSMRALRGFVDCRWVRRVARYLWPIATLLSLFFWMIEWRQIALNGFWEYCGIWNGCQFSAYAIQVRRSIVCHSHSIAMIVSPSTATVRVTAVGVRPDATTHLEM